MRRSFRRTGICAALWIALGAPGHAADYGDLDQTPKQTGSNVRALKQGPANVKQLEESVSLKSTAAKPESAQPVSSPSTADSAAKTSTGPDEAQLWRMLNGRHYAALLNRIERLRADYPHWQPPSRLVSLAREGLLHERIALAVDGRDAHALIALAQAHPAEFDCRNLAAAWALSEAHAALNQAEKAENVARSLLACPNEDDRLATLYKTKSWLPPARWERLLAIEEGERHTPEGTRRVAQIRYDDRLEQLIRASDGKEYDRATGIFVALTPEIDARKDAATALLGAWSYYALKQYAGAATWFERALSWNAASDDARRGLALCFYQQERYDVALRQVKAMSGNAAGRTELERDILIAQAQASRTSRQYVQSLALLDAAKAQSALPRYARLLAAWNHLDLGQTDIAADEFSALYREEPDPESAQGALATLVRAGRDEDLHRLAVSEPLAGLMRSYRADQAFTEKRFLLSRSLAPERYAASGSVAASQLAAFAAIRSKSGDPGLSKMDMAWRPSFEAALPAGSTGEVRLRMDRIHLDSATLPANAVIGRAPVAATSYTHEPITEMQGWQPRISWRDERWQSLEIGLGATPGNGQVDSTWTARVEFLRNFADTHLELSAYRDSVRESILSYTGLRDPYLGGNWGRVIKNGAQAVLRTRLDGRWSLNMQAGAESLTGEQVANNRRAFGEIGIAYDIRLPGFDYAVAGADMNFDRFDKNLSHFTTGQGGYFSPQHYWRAGPFLDFRTAEDRPWIVRGRISAGRTGRTEDMSPFFPLNPDGRTFDAASGTGSAYDAEFGGMWRLGPSLQFGVQVTKRHSPQYSDHAVVGFLRILFEPRMSVLSRDLPISSAKDLF